MTAKAAAKTEKMAAKITQATAKAAKYRNMKI